MIEALVRHFEEHGFTVYVLPGVLLIRKVVAQQVFGYNWAISQVELQELKAVSWIAFEHADHIIEWLNQAIADKGAS